MRHTQDTADQLVKAATNGVREYAGAPALKQLMELLDALITAYSLDLFEVTADQLAFRQAAIKQVAALRDVLGDAPHSSPRI